MLQLRPYQNESIDAVFDYWRDNPNGSPLVVLPTGAGKSLVFAKLIQNIADRAENPEAAADARIVQVTHVKELIEQNYKELLGVWEWAPAGIFSASLGRRDAGAQIMFAGIQTVWNKAERIGWVDALLVDEAHLIPPDAKTMYGRFIAALRRINPNMLVVGMTATPYRVDSGRLDEGDDRLFDAIVYEVSIRDLIDWGFLVPLKSKATSTVLSVKGVGRSGADFNSKQLEAAVDKHPITAAAVDEVIRYGMSNEEPRRAWLGFCAGVEHAHHVAEELRRQGIAAEAVDGGMKRAERDRIIAAFRAGKLKALTNANILTTGFNVPHVDLLFMLRPTKSTSLYVQMVGRGTRCVGANIEESIANGKADCLVLDFAGNVRRHGPVDAVKVKKPGEGGGEAPIKECPTCHSLIFASARECPDCGHVFERDVEKKMTAAAGSSPILSRGGPEFVKVQRRIFFRHDKPGSATSVRVQYTCGSTVHKEWICPEHSGGARRKFEKFWRLHCGNEPPPRTVDETLSRARELREVAAVRIRPQGPYWEICGHQLAGPSLPPRDDLSIVSEQTMPAATSGAEVAGALAKLAFGARR